MLQQVDARPQSEWDDLVDLPSNGYLDHIPLFPELEDVSCPDQNLGIDMGTFAGLDEGQLQMLHGSPGSHHRGLKRSTGNRDLHSQLCAAGPGSLPSLDVFVTSLGQSPAAISRPPSSNRARRASTHSTTKTQPVDPAPLGHHNLSHQASDSSMHSMDSAVSVSSKRGLRIVGGYRCDECNALFDVPSDLRHHQRKHMSKDDRPYACAICSDRFLYPKDLVRHMRRKHGIQRESQQDVREDGVITTTVGNIIEPVVSDESALQVGRQSDHASLSSHYDRDAFETNETLTMKLKAAREDAGLWLAERNYYAELVSRDNQHQAPLLYFKYDEMGRTPPVQRARGWLLAIKALLTDTKNEPFMHAPERTVQALDCLMNDLGNLAIFESSQ